MIIVVANSKGGVGKSTISVHLAAWLQEKGHRVTFADCDAQESSSQWIRESVPGMNLVRLSTPNEILNELPQLEADADYVVADGPGSDADRGVPRIDPPPDLRRCARAGGRRVEDGGPRPGSGRGSRPDFP